MHCAGLMQRWISHLVDPNELVLELPGATSLETALLSILIDQCKRD